MTPRHKFKRIKKNGNDQKNSIPRGSKNELQTIKLQIVTTLQLSHQIISCDSTIPDTGILDSDSSKMVLGVQDTKQNYKTKALKMSKGSMPQMPLVKRRKKCGKVKKMQTPRMYKKKLKSQLDMRPQWSLKSNHDNNVRLHNNTLNRNFIDLRSIMKSVIGAFHKTFPLQDRLLLKSQE